MVTKSEEAELNRLESQAEHGGGGAWEYLSLVRKLKVRRSDYVLKHGLSILNDPKKRSALGDEVWTLYEQVAVAALDCNSLDVALDCMKLLRKKFPESKRVSRLEAMLFEARGCWEEAEKAYSSLLEDNSVDQVIHKRRVAIAKAQGDSLKAIELLNKYLEIFMADHEAWRELAEIYVSLQMYKQAAFCYEELILSQPTAPLYHLTYADRCVARSHPPGFCRCRLHSIVNWVLGTCITTVLPQALTLEHGLATLKDAFMELELNPPTTSSGLIRFEVAVPPSAKAFSWFCTEPESPEVFPQFYVSKESNMATQQSTNLNSIHGFFWIGVAVDFGHLSSGDIGKLCLFRSFLQILDG